MTLTAEQLAAKEADLTRREAALKSQESGKLRADNLAFAEGLVTEGRLLAANKAAVVAVLDFASGVVTGDTIEFGEGDAKKSEAPLATIKNILSGSPKVIEFGEMASGPGVDPSKKDEPIPGDIAKYI